MASSKTLVHGVVAEISVRDSSCVISQPHSKLLDAEQKLEDGERYADHSTRICVFQMSVDIQMI